jgi:hypothetical protein
MRLLHSSHHSCGIVQTESCRRSPNELRVCRSVPVQLDKERKLLCSSGRVLRMSKLENDGSMNADDAETHVTVSLSVPDNSTGAA